MRHTIDPKIDRISSWLDLDRADAAWSASVADEATTPAGTPIGHHRFAHVVLTGPDAGLTVGAGERPVVLRGPGSMLALTAASLRELDRRRATTPAARSWRQPIGSPAL